MSGGEHFYVTPIFPWGRTKARPAACAALRPASPSMVMATLAARTVRPPRIEPWVPFRLSEQRFPSFSAAAERASLIRRRVRTETHLEFSYFGRAPVEMAKLELTAR